MSKIEDQTNFYNSKAKKTGWRDFIRLDFISLSAFTMAEILISLTIIGVIAAITLPSLKANINEKTWATQKKALYSRMSQAISMMPSLNGYGEYAGTWSDNNVSVSQDTAAEKFVTNGLAMVLNINNICSIPMSMTNLTDRHKELAKCGIPDNLTTLANSKMSFPTKLSELNPMFTSTLIQGTSTYINPQNNIDTNVAAFETSNGESVAAFYNPFCQADANVEEEHYVQPYMCANFIYDLNGKKGPNKVGKDIGFISALYPVETEVVAPMPLTKNAGTSSMKQMLAAAACREQDINSRLPNADELSSMFYNRQLVGILSGSYWSSVIDLKYNIKLSNTADHKAIRQAFGSGKRASFRRESKSNVRCIKR